MAEREGRAGECGLPPSPPPSICSYVHYCPLPTNPSGVCSPAVSSSFLLIPLSMSLLDIQLSKTFFIHHWVNLPSISPLDPSFTTSSLYGAIWAISRADLSVGEMLSCFVRSSRNLVAMVMPFQVNPNCCWLQDKLFLLFDSVVIENVSREYERKRKTRLD